MKCIANFLLCSLFQLTVCSQFCRAQTPELDSLSAILKKTNADTGRVSILKKIVFIWTDMNPDTAMIYIDQLRSLGKNSAIPGAIIYADVKLAELYNMKGNYTEAGKINEKNLVYAGKNGTPYQRCDVYKTIAMGYSMQERNDSALSYYLRALKIYEENRDSLNMAKVMVNMGVVHDNMGDYAKAISYCKIAKEIFKGKIPNAYLVTLTNLAQYETYLGQYENSEAHFKEALLLAKQAGNFNSLAHLNSGLAYMAYSKKDYPAMLLYAGDFEQVGKEMANEYFLIKAKLAMGKALFFNERFNEAESYLKEVLRSSDKLEDKQLLKDVYAIYADLLLKKGNIKEFDVYRQKIDSMTLQENKNLVTRATKDLEAQYETEKKDNQIRLQSASLKQKQLWNYFLIGALGALFVIGFISFRNYRQRQKLAEKEKTLQQQRIEQLEKEKQLAATQAVLQGQDEERSRLAKDLHDGLGGMLSGVKFSFNTMKENMIMTPENQQSFARNMDMLDGIIHELRRVAHNMMPESLIKFGLDDSLKDMCNFVEQNTSLHINYQGLGMQELSVDKNIAVHIYRIVQELLNNIVKHSNATEALVQVVYSEGHFAVTVEDNGKGFDPEAIRKSGRNTGGMGWINIQNRVDSLKGMVNVQSSAQKGTSIFIEFNV